MTNAAGRTAEGSTLVDAAREKLNGLASRLCDPLFRNEPPDDLAAHDTTSLAEASRIAAQALGENDEGSATVLLDTVDAPAGTLAILTLVNKNRPFIVDSVLAAIIEQRLDIRLVAHPIVSREGEPARKGADDALSLMQVHMADPGERAREALRGEIVHIMRRVNDATSGWHAMLDRLDGEIETFENRANATDKTETLRFLRWLRDGNFIFLGMRDYRFDGDGGTLTREDKPGLGILSDPDLRVLRRDPAKNGSDETSPHIQAFLTGEDSLIVTKANTQSVVHRRAYLDYVGLKRLGPDGAEGELRIVGLFTSSAYSQSVLSIPYLDTKARGVLERLSLDPASHSGKALLNVLETYPRDELFQIDADQLALFAAEIVHAGERPRVRVLSRVDRFHRFVSSIVLVPKERYNTRVRERIGELLSDAFDGRVSAYYPDFPEGPLARVHFIIGRDGSQTPEPDTRALEGEVDRISADWDALFDRASAGMAGDISFPAPYKESVASTVRCGTRASLLHSDRTNWMSNSPTMRTSPIG